MSPRADLARLEGELDRLEDAHDFDNDEPDPRIEKLVARIAELSLGLDGPVDATAPWKPETESAKRSDRRREQRAAERRRRAARTRTVRRCKCGCGEKIPPEADPRRKFHSGKHRDAYHNRNK